MAFIFVTVLIDMLAFSVIIPVLPMLVQNFMGGNAARAAEMYGVFGTAWALMQFIFSPVQGSLSDHFGRRPVILVSCAGLGLDFFHQLRGRNIGNIKIEYDAVQILLFHHGESLPARRHCNNLDVASSKGFLPVFPADFLLSDDQQLLWHLDPNVLARPRPAALSCTLCRA